MPEYLPGEIVDITIKGARISQMHQDPDDAPEMTVYLECEIGGCPVRVPHHWPMVTVERVGPAGWPPRAGDLWRDRDGDLWLTCEHESGLVMVCASGRAGRTVEQATTRFGPLSLVHREDEQDAGPDDEPTTWTDGAGVVWDLTARYADRYGKTWHWAGGFETPPTGAPPWEPLWSRDDWSIHDARLGALMQWHGPLTLVQQKEAKTDG